MGYIMAYKGCLNIFRGNLRLIGRKVEYLESVSIYYRVLSVTYNSFTWYVYLLTAFSLISAPGAISKLDLQGGFLFKPEARGCKGGIALQLFKSASFAFPP